MSRLDDELKIAFKRKDAPPDLLARVLARLDEPAPVIKRSWRDRLASFFGIGDMRLVAAAVAALLVVAIAAAWYLAPRERAVDSTPQTAQKETAPDKADPRVHADEGVKNQPAPQEVQPKNQGKVATGKPGGVRRASNLVARGVRPKVSPEAEAAKEKVMYALQIASDTLNDVQRVIQNDGHTRGESERNR